MLLKEAFTRYRDEVIVLRGQSIRTEEGFMHTATIVSRFFDNAPIESLTPQDIRKLHQHFRKQDLSVNTIRNYLFHIKSVLEYARLQKYDVFNPELITIPKRELTIPEYLTPEEINEILASIVVRRGSNKLSVLRDKAIVSMLYATGLRASELCNLEIHGYESRKASVIGKGGKPRIVFWDDRTDMYLRQYLSARNDQSDYLFVSNNGDKLKRHSLVAIFIRLQKLTNNPKLHAHTLRHSFATNLMQNGMHIYTISRLLGHSSILTTSKYLHVSDPLLEKEYAEFHTI